MNFASNFAFISSRPNVPFGLSDVNSDEDEDLNLNVFVVTFEGTKLAEQQLAGGDPYQCKECKAILSKYSNILWQEDLQKSSSEIKMQLQKGFALWRCEFCAFPNSIRIEKEQIPQKDDVVYMLESEHMTEKSENTSTLVFCIDASGSMNSTSVIEGKVELKYGISQEQIEMLRQFMEPGDEAQLNYFPGAQNQNKTFISRKQCILSAIQSQLNQIKKTDPFKKIGFVIFNSEVTAVGDNKSESVHIVGDKLLSKEAIVNSLANFKLQDPIADSFQNLINSINKTEAKGQTALGPALVTALNIAGKGNPGSSVILCTDGLANIGIGQLEPYEQQKKKFYVELGEEAKGKNITVNIVTIKGEGCKMEAIGKLAEITNGNVKVVNPQKLSDDFANVLKDEVVGLNVLLKVMLHKSMKFRNEVMANLTDNNRILEKQIANATKNTRISFEYESKTEKQLLDNKIDISTLKKIPFQTQIEYTSTTGGKFLRVISSECNTTTLKDQMVKNANLGVVHQRITSQTAALYQAGDYKQSQKFNDKWANYLNENFQEKEYEEHQNKFMAKNVRLNKAIKHKHRKSIEKKQALEEVLSEEDIAIMKNHSDIDSDSDQQELVDNLMERQCYSIIKRRYSRSNSRSVSRSKSKAKKVIRKSPLKEQKEVEKKEKKSEKIVQKKQLKEYPRKKSVPRRRRSVSSSDSC